MIKGVNKILAFLIRELKKETTQEPIKETETQEPVKESIKQTYVMCINTDNVTLEEGTVYLVIGIVPVTILKGEFFYQLECAEKGLLSGLWDPARFVVVTNDADKKSYHTRKFMQSFKNI